MFRFGRFEGNVSLATDLEKLNLLIVAMFTFCETDYFKINFRRVFLNDVNKNAKKRKPTYYN